MRVSKTQLINGILDYADSEVIPHIEDKPTQIIVSIALNTIRGNPKIADSFLENPMVSKLLDKNDDGYEIEGLFKAIGQSIDTYGSFPVVIPPIPILSPVEKTLTFSKDDVSEMKRRIERSA